jgi:hypothetical protein
LIYIHQPERKEVASMLIYKSGNKVGKGTYWDLASGQRVDVENETVLIGESATYLRIPAGMMLVAGPLIGLFYVISLPFIGIATFLAFLAGKVVNSLLSVIGKSLSFGWRPKEAYLSGKKKTKKGSK